jgi:pilus assembly protein CpaE
MKSWIKKKSRKSEAAMPTPDFDPMAMAPQGQPPMQAGQVGAQIMPQVVAGQAYPPAAQMLHPTAQHAPMAPQTPAAPQAMGMAAPTPMQQTPYGQVPQAMPAAPTAPLGQPPMPMQATQLQPQVPVAPQPQVQMQAQPAVSASPLIAMPEAEEKNREGGEVALPAISIHAFCDRPETAGSVQATTRDWRMGRTNLKVYMGGLPAAADYYHKENTPNLILVESGLRGPELFKQLESLASVCDAGTKVVVIGATNDIRLYRELMDKGVSDYLVPPFHPLTLIRSLTELYVDPDKPFTGRVAAFFGAKGGVGSSTIAHNVAWGLSTTHNQETALVDLDASWGTTGLDFNYDNIQGLEEALASPDRLDETLLDRIMLRHTEKLSLLPAAATLNNAGMENAKAYQAIVEGIRKISPMTVLDLPHYWTEWTSKVLVGADDVIITATPDLACLRNTKNLMEFFKAERPNDPAPLLVLNKTGVPKTPEISVKDFGAALGVEPTLVLPYEPVLYAQAANDGKMLSDMKSDNKAVDGFAYLGQRLRTGSFDVMKLNVNTKGSGGSLLSKFKKKK